METLVNLLPLVLLVVIMYFFMIKPQKKKDKQIKEMRSNLQVGDEIVTIGGICAKVVKTKEESIVIQVGADKVKMEVMRWSVSKVVKKGSGRIEKAADDHSEAVEAEENESKKSKPRRMKKAAVVEEPAEAAAEEAPEAPETEAEESVEKTEEEK